MQNPFFTNNLFYFKIFSFARVHSLIVKNISISIYSIFFQIFQIQTIQSSISIDFVYTQLNDKTDIF